MVRKYQILNILSIDIVAGAVISALFFSKIFQVQVKVHGLIALALTVWIIYTIDHLRDALKISHQASTLRHRFHQQNFRPLLLFLLIAILADAVIIFFIRRQVFEWGLVLSAVVMLYLTFHRSLRFLKELLIASLYTAGILLLSITTTRIETGINHYLLIFQFAVIAWTNLVLFSWFDHDFDQKDDQNSFVTIFGKGATMILLSALFALNFVLTIIQLLMTTPTAPALILLSMNIVLFLVFIFRKTLEKNEVYRLVGDAVFLIPALFLI